MRHETQFGEWGLSVALCCLWLAPACGQLKGLQDAQPKIVFAGEARRIEVVLQNSGSELAKVDLHTRLYQTTTATAVLLREAAWKPLEVLPGQTVREIATLDFPTVRAETRFLIQWLDGPNTVLGKTEVRVFPTNLLARLRPLAGDLPLGLFDPANQLKPLLRMLAIEFQNLIEDGTDKFRGRLAIIGPFATQKQIRESLSDDVRALAKRGVAVVWLQPPSECPARFKPSFYTVRVRDGVIVVAQGDLVSGLAESPEAQLNLIRLAETALHPEPLDLPETRNSN